MTGRPLTARDFVRIADGGFGDPHNGRAQSLAWFRDRLYVGVTRQPSRAGGVPGDGRLASRVNPARFVDQRGEIWAYDPDSGEWARAFVSPMAGQVPRDAGYRKMAVFKGPSDSAPALYVGSVSVAGGQILRSPDGRRFAPVPRPGPGVEHAWSFRTFAVHDGRLHTSASGRVEGGAIERNAGPAALVFSSAEPAQGGWRADNRAGFGDPRNDSVYELATFRRRLYAATTNFARGFEVWRTGAGGDPRRWERLVARGAGRGVANEGAPVMCAFRDALYVGTGRQGNPGGAPPGTSPGGEVIRLGPHGDWELVVGERRRTAWGVKGPVTGLGPGFDDPDNTDVLELVAHDGWLYAGTGNTGAIPLLLLRRRCGPAAQRRIDAALSRRGGFALWRSRDGSAWAEVTGGGFGSLHSNCTASMLSTPAGLVIGTGTVPAAADGSGGCEVWLGRPAPGRR
jgi:hypothetical protein